MFTGLCQTGNWGIFGNWGGWGWLGLILTLIFWAGLIISAIFLTLWVIRRLRSSPLVITNGSQPTSAKEILQVRFARGELTREQYELMQRDIA